MKEDKPYTPVSNAMKERLLMAIAFAETMPLQWAEENANQAFFQTVKPIELINKAEKDYLLVETETGEQYTIRLDLIRNFPTPMK